MHDWHVWFENRYTVGVVAGVISGVIARSLMLRTDYRQYPTYPHGQIIHLALGVIAAGLGAVAVPALLDKQYTAVTFLALAAQQFRDVRKMERETLAKLDELELVPRGAAYIEGIAMVFEGRNYLVILTAFSASLCAVLWAWYWGAAAGLLLLVVCQVYKSGTNLGAAVHIDPAAVRIDGPDLYVGNIYIMNVGLEDDRKQIQQHGMGFILQPKNKKYRVSIANLGQRQAILHNLSVILGVYRDSGEPALVPLSKLNLKDGRLGVFFLTAEPDEAQALDVLKRVPLLETALRLPSRRKDRTWRRGAAP